MEEILLVDINDNIVGYADKISVHKTGILHRAFSVFLLNDNKMLIQKRNVNKYHSGGLWSNACCSHQRRNENLEASVKRGLKTELGIEVRCHELFHFVYRTQFAEDLYEYEVDHVFVGKFDGEIRLNKEEAEIAEWIKIEDLEAKLTKNPELFTSWFITAAPRVIEIYGCTPWKHPIALRDAAGLY